MPKGETLRMSAAALWRYWRSIHRSRGSISA
jgi:hypothetical protein